MSKFVNAIKAHPTGKLNAPLSALTVNDTWMHRPSITAREYLIGRVGNREVHRARRVAPASRV
jgi:hypothetical protein